MPVGLPGGRRGVRLAPGYRKLYSAASWGRLLGADFAARHAGSGGAWTIRFLLADLGTNAK